MNNNSNSNKHIKLLKKSNLNELKYKKNEELNRNYNLRIRKFIVNLSKQKILLKDYIDKDINTVFEHNSGSLPKNSNKNNKNNHNINLPLLSLRLNQSNINIKKTYFKGASSILFQSNNKKEKSTSKNKSSSSLSSSSIENNKERLVLYKDINLNTHKDKEISSHSFNRLCYNNLKDYIKIEKEMKFHKKLLLNKCYKDFLHRIKLKYNQEKKKKYWKDIVNFLLNLFKIKNKTINLEFYTRKDENISDITEFTRVVLSKCGYTKSLKTKS